MAATSLGRLTLDLVAQIGNFVGPMNQAERKAKDASKGISDSFNVASVAAKVFGAVVAGASVAGVTAFVNQTINAGNEVKKFSELANASMSQFQYYAKGAQTAGFSMESFANKMKDIQDRIGDFQQTGGGPLADFFENIAPLVGVTIQQFQKLSGPEALQLFYDSLVKVGSTQNDIKFYMEQIISDSSLLIPLLENGGEGFKKWGDAAQSAGAILSDSMVDQLALAKENLQLLDIQWQGFQATLVNNVVPVVQTVSENLDTIKAVAMALGAAIATKLVVQMGFLGVEFVKGVIEGVRYQMTLAAMAGQTITLTTATVGLRTAMMGLVGGAGGLAVLAVQAIAAGAAFLYMKNSSNDAKDALADQIENVDELTSKYATLNGEQRQLEASKLRAKIEEEAHAVELATNKYVALSMAKEGIWTVDQINAFNKLIQDVAKNGVDTNIAFTSIKNTGLFNQEDLDSIARLNSGFGEANTKLKSHQNLLDTLTKKNKDVADSHNNVASSVNAQAQAYLSLTQKQREALKEINGSLARDRYIKANMNAGWSREQAEYTADYREKAGLGYTGKTLSSAELQTVKTGYELIKQNESREKTEKAIEESKKKQAETAEKQYTYSKQELLMLQKVAAISTQNNLDGIGAKYGIPKNILAAVMAQESKGNVNAKSSTGAIGPFQTTGIYRKQYNMSIADSYDVQKAAEVAAKDLAKSFEVFGNWKDAITAYNAGVGGTKSLNRSGFTGSAAKTKEAKEYAPLVNKWLVGLGGSDKKDSGFLSSAESAESLKDYREYQEEMKRLAADLATKQKEIQVRYYNDWQNLEADNQEKIKDIQESFANDPAERDRLIELQAKAYEVDVGNWLKAQDEKVAAEREANKQILAERYNLINSSLAMQGQIKGLSSGAEDINARASMSPQAYAKWSLSNNRSNAQLDLKNQRVGVEQDIMTSDLYSNEDDRYQALLDAHQEYRDGLAAIDVAYDQQVKDLALSQSQTQMDIWQDLLSRTGAIFSSMAEMVKNTAGESSAAYKVMFLTNQGISMAQAMINTEVAATKAMAEGGYVMGIPMATAIRGLGYASVGLIAGQTIAGMAHNGIDNIPKEGTWLLDGGERVLNPNQNRDLTRYLESARQNTGGQSQVNLNPNFVIVDERESLGDYLFSPDGTKAFVKFFKRNRSALGV